MAGRVNMRKHSRIMKCKPEDKKDGRKHPIEDQVWCLKGKHGDEILYAAPTRKDVEKQERAVQYYKHNAAPIEVVDSADTVYIARASHPHIPEINIVEVHGLDYGEVEYEMENSTDHYVDVFLLENGIRSGTPEHRKLLAGIKVDEREIPLGEYAEYRSLFGDDPSIVQRDMKQLATDGIVYLHADKDYERIVKLLNKTFTKNKLRDTWTEVDPFKVTRQKPQASVILGGKVFRRALIQAEVPGIPNWKMRVALTEEEMESKLRPWLSKLVKFAHAIEDAQEQLLTRLPRKADLIKKIKSHYASLVKSLDVNKLASAADAYGDVGMELIEISNDLQEIFGQRSTYANYLRQIAPALDKLGKDDPTKILFQEAVASLHADEVVA